MKQSRTHRARRAAAGALVGVLAAGTAAAVAPGAEAAVDAQASTKASTQVSAKTSPKQSPRAFGLTADGTLVSFALRKPGQLTTIGKVRNTGGQSIVGMDIRPSNGRLYAVGREGGLFTINKTTARATRVTTLDVPLRGGHFGVDVNPAADALRIVSNTGQNLRHAFEGNVTTADSTLNVPDTTPQVTGIVSAAYTNNDGNDTTGTALFDINATSDTVVLQIPANSGTITTQGPLGVNTSTRSGFDILSFRRDGKTINNVGWATLGGKKGYALYRVNLTSGKATKVGAFKRLVVDLAVRHVNL